MISEGSAGTVRAYKIQLGMCIPVWFMLIVSVTTGAVANDGQVIQADESVSDQIRTGTKPQIEIERAAPKLQRSISRGLQWLARQQSHDGSFGSQSQYGRHVGITALACLAFMSDGHMPGRGQYAGNVESGLKFVLESCSQQSGLIAAETSYGPMYGHGFAALFLAEMYGMSHRSDLREKLQKAVMLIVRTQNKQGGWRYHPRPEDADLSVTICQVMALRAARNAGIAVPKSTIDRAVKYVQDSQNPDGGFRYMLDSSGSMFARSAAGVAALYYAGRYETPAIKRGLVYLEKFTPGKTEEQTHYFYGHYYAAQAFYQAGGEHWAQWWPAIRDELMIKQSPEGYWRGQAGTEYGTAMALIILQVPKQVLPIFQR
ncbi:MAG: terpene cyclase/mutase family protein [Phycisphaerales bacterium]|nr:terpene cyclase/mutase family protein [Phycisphaerales bacterium]